MATTYTALLDAIDNAILGLLAGTVQEYTVANRTFRKLDLDALRRFRAEIAPLAGREAAGRSGPGVHLAVPS
ncbi:MAG: hypothetical protein AB7H93_23565 [Vicinamibacterales bacterium]